MQIRKIGQQPTEKYSLLPNDLARDKRLSYRARGVMAAINSHADGYHVNADLLSAVGLEGRDAIRTAMNELVDCGYLRRVRRQGGDGQWRTDINVYIHGDAPPVVGTATTVLDAVVVDEDFTDDGFPGVGEPTTDFQASVFQPLETGPIREDQSEDHLSVSVLGDDGSPTTEVPVVAEGSSQVVTAVRALPVVYQRLLAQRHGVLTPEQQEAWSSAWDRAEEIKGSVPFEPYDHLAMYLTGCVEGRHRAVAQRWLRFFIEDRGEFITKMRVEMERSAREEETPQEREDRYNARRPEERVIPFCPGCGCDPTADEPHKDGCRMAAKAATGERA